jgi:hypothetical protein
MIWFWARRVTRPDVEEHELEELEAAVARRYREVAPLSASAVRRPSGDGPVSCYYDQMVPSGEAPLQGDWAVMSHHLASRIHAVLCEQRDYVLRDTDGREVTPQEARTIILTRYRVPAEIRAERRTSRRRKPYVSTSAHRGSAKRSSQRSSASSQVHSTRSRSPDQPKVPTIAH